ncbi:MAG: excinuclease ABC subunit UvrC [Clostridia bacterium]|nr:excinuclease ABC subunit UvrC [Clostridia bacterium]
MVNEKYAAALRSKAATLPLSPGVYIMKDETGKVIYVGKSRSLKNRVSQYWNVSDKGVKTDRMTSAIRDFEYIVCSTEIEALSLENSLIKKYRPRYNIKLKDDKNYPFIKLSKDEWPVLSVTRARKSDGAKYFGPYTGTKTAYDILGAVTKVFGLPKCKMTFPRDIGRVKNCLYRSMNACCAPCSGNMTAEEYRALYEGAASFLAGGYRETAELLKKNMREAAAAHAYEAAAKYRDRIFALEKLREKQKAVASPDLRRDVVAFTEDEFGKYIGIIYIRDGRILDSENFIYPPLEIFDSAAVTAFIADLYLRRGDFPDAVLLRADLNEADTELLCEWLSSHAGRKVRIELPKKGEKSELCDMAEKNVLTHAVEKRKVSQGNEQVLIRLAAVCGLEVVPEKIEAFDISNYGDEAITASMVRFEGGAAKRAKYRTFNIRHEGRDDYAAMKEAVIRRLTRARDENDLPDLILLDGGAGHLSSVGAAMAENGFDVPVFGMVKDDFHKTRALVGFGGEISIAGDGQLYSLIYRIQEEAHRFAISRSGAKKSKALRRSSLENIKGVGPAKAKKLLRAMPISEIKSADEKKLAEVAGISAADARSIYDYFHNNDKENTL